MTEINIGGRKVPLMFTTYEMIAIQEKIGCTASQLRDEVFGIRQDEESGKYYIDMVDDPQKVRKLGALITILGNAGLEDAGQEPDLTEKWVLRHIKPGVVLAYALITMAEINTGMKMETAEQAKESGPVDVVLEEENRKKEPGK